MNDQSLPQRVKLTREELYAQVWAEPMQHLAKRYGLSDRGLAKMCERMCVPVPGRGYWARKAAGKTVRRPPLTPLGTLRGVVEREVSLTVVPDLPETEDGPGELQERFESLPENRIVVPDEISAFRVDVRLTARSFTRVGKAANEIKRAWGKGCLDIRVSKATQGRALRIMNTLLNGAEARGFGVKLSHAEEPRCEIVAHGEGVAVVLEERSTRIENDPPQKVRTSSGWYTPYYNRYTLEPSGRLTLRLDGYYHSIRHSWNDGERQRIEGCLNDVMVAIVRAAEIERERREERERDEKERREKALRRAEEARRQEEERQRVELLDQQLAAWEKASRIRAYVRAVTESRVAGGRTIEPGGLLSAWFAWVSAYADRTDPTADGQIWVPTAIAETAKSERNSMENSVETEGENEAKN